MRNTLGSVVLTFATLAVIGPHLGDSVKEYAVWVFVGIGVFWSAALAIVEEVRKAARQPPSEPSQLPPEFRQAYRNPVQGSA